MVNPLVERATSDLLIGPDWAKNAEICDILIHDPGQVKDVVKGIKKRIGSKNQKAQILALTLLETLMNNCGDFVHMHVAERGVLQKMVKIAKRKRNYYVREKILMLIDIWQEAFGGPGARYPQYHAAFHSLSRSGAVFPRRSDPRAPIFAPPQIQFPSSYAPNLREPGHQQERAEVSEDSDFPTLSLSEIQNARGLVDILAEMLNGLEPGNKEGLRQEAIVDLVQQCRTYKQRVVHLVNSTTDESLLRQGLGLNDDLQRLLAKHEAIASGTSSEVEKSNPVVALIELDDPKQPDEKNLSSNPANQSPLDLLVPTADDLLAPSTKIDPGMDLLSGGDNGSPTENSLAIVPVGEQQANSPVSQQNNNALSVVLAQNDASANSLDPKSMYQAGQAFPSTPQYQYEQNMQSPHAAIYSDGSNIGSPQYQQQQHEHLVNGTQGGSYLPPPPWEAQTMENQQMAYPHYPQAMQITQQMHSGVDSYSVGNNQAVVMYVQPMTSSQLGAVHNQPIQSNHQLVGMHQSFQGSTMMAMVPHGANMYNQSMQSNMQLQDHYGAQSQYLEQRMYGLTVGGDTAANNSPYQVPTSSYLPPMKPSRPQDNLFGDLVNMAKSKPKNSSVGTPGST